jgi:hypothetical protein
MFSKKGEDFSHLFYFPGLFEGIGFPGRVFSGRGVITRKPDHLQTFAEYRSGRADQSVNFYHFNES